MFIAAVFAPSVEIEPPIFPANAAGMPNALPIAAALILLQFAAFIAAITNTAYVASKMPFALFIVLFKFFIAFSATAVSSAVSAFGLRVFAVMGVTNKIAVLSPFAVFKALDVEDGWSSMLSAFAIVKQFEFASVAEFSAL